MEEANKENEFERLLKQKAERFEVKPSPEVWQNVQAAIQKDRRRRFAWWLMAAMLFAVLGMGAYFMLENKPTQSTAFSVAEKDADQKEPLPNHSSSTKKENDENQSVRSQPDSQLQEKSSNANIAEESSFQNQRDLPSRSDQAHEKSSITHAVISNETVTQAASENNLAIIPQDESIHRLSHDELIQQFPQIQRLPQKDPRLHLKNDDLLLKKSSLDFSSVPASNTSLWLEADVMPVASFVRSNISSPPGGGAATNPLPVFSSSYTFVKGFSTGGNLMLEKDKKWLFGIGAHLSKTHLEAVTGEQAIPQYDTGYYAIGDTIQMEIAYQGDAVIQQSKHSVNQWFDASLFAGVRLFPNSKNHIRMLAGAGYSRLLSNKISSEQTNISALDANYTGTHAPASTVDSSFSYQKNQLQFFSEIAYQRDLSSRLSFTTGMQVHYYPMNLLNGNENSQHLVWLGLKAGLLFRL